MRRLVLLGATVAVLAFAAPAQAEEVKVLDPTPTGALSDSTDKGYVSVNTNGTVRACNESGAYGDDLSGYIWVNPYGEPTNPTYGTPTVGAGDYDGRDRQGAPPRPNDCP